MRIWGCASSNASHCVLISQCLLARRHGQRCDPATLSCHGAERGSGCLAVLPLKSSINQRQPGADDRQRRLAILRWPILARAVVNGRPAVALHERQAPRSIHSGHQKPEPRVRNPGTKLLTLAPADASRQIPVRHLYPNPKHRLHLLPAHCRQRARRSIVPVHRVILRLARHPKHPPTLRAGRCLR